MNEFNVINTGMSKKCIIKALIMFTAGAGVGVTISNLVFKKKYEAVAIAEMESYRSYVLNQVDGEIVEGEEIPENVVLTDEDREEISSDVNEFAERGQRADTSNVEEAADMSEDHKTKIEYNKMAGNYTQEMNKKKAEIMGKQPEEITEEAYVTDYLDHDKLTLYYYMGDKVISNEDESVLMDQQFTLGDEIINRLKTEELEDLHVRNFTYGIDYEIIMVDGEYQDMVMGGTVMEKRYE